MNNKKKTSDNLHPGGLVGWSLKGTHACQPNMTFMVSSIVAHHQGMAEKEKAQHADEQHGCWTSS